MKKLLSFLLAACLLVTLFVPAAATEVTDPTEPTNVPREPGYCGESITWTLENGTLTITGVGAMDDFTEGAPWADRKDEITKVVISKGITYVGACAFRNFDALTSVEFGTDVYEIGKEAFYSCEGLTVIHLPASFKVFGESSFLACSKLTEIHCEGRFPSFRLNCFWDTYATIYFPAERPWSVENIKQLEEAFHGRIEFLASDGSDPYNPTEATEAPTEPETTPPTTQPPTEPVTEPSEEATEPVQTVPPTTLSPTEEATEPTKETAPVPTEPGQEDSGGISWIPIAILGSVTAFLLLGTLIFRAGSRKGKYSAKRRRR